MQAAHQRRTEEQEKNNEKNAPVAHFFKLAQIAMQCLQTYLAVLSLFRSIRGDDDTSAGSEKDPKKYTDFCTDTINMVETVRASILEMSNPFDNPDLDHKFANRQSYKALKKAYKKIPPALKLFADRHTEMRATSENTNEPLSFQIMVDNQHIGEKLEELFELRDGDSDMQGWEDLFEEQFCGA